MSVNGLDSSAVADAYQSALVDPGAWFLLHYKSRDELDILKRGTGAWQELRSALEAYEEKSPLYGFFLYRRRKIILKYIPEGTSRLLQVRTTVHYQAIEDHFSPHDASFSATAPTDLSDAALAATCSLHTETTLDSPEDSLRRRTLSEITEDAEEPQSSNPEVSNILARLKANKAALAKADSEDPPILTKTEGDAEPGEPSYPTRETPPVDSELSYPPASEELRRPLTPDSLLSADNTLRERGLGLIDALRNTEPPRPSFSRRDRREARAKEKVPVHNARAESPHLYPRTPRRTGDGIRADLFDLRRNAGSIRPDLNKPRKDGGSVRSDMFDQNHSIYDSRPGTSDSKYSFLTWKPKVKLFPRPAAEDSLNRPQTENSVRQKLPSGMRIALGRGESVPKAPKSEKSPKSTRTHRSEKSKKAPELTTAMTSFEPMPATPDTIKQDTVQRQIDDAKGASAEAKVRRKPLPLEPLEGEQSASTAQPSPIDQAKSSMVQTANLIPKSSQSSMTKTALAPEKQRLMKALQQRNKQMGKAPAPLEDDSSLAIKSDDKTLQGATDQDTMKADSGVELGGTEAATARLLEQDQQSKLAVVGVVQPEAANAALDGSPLSQIDGTNDHSSRDQLSKEAAKKRRTLVKSVKTKPSLGDESDDGFASDDSLMDELQHATVEHARTISIPGLSETNQGSPSSPTGDRTPIIASARPIVYRNGSVSDILGPNGEQIMASQARSPALISVERSSPDRPSAVRRTNVSTGISRRIKALAELSNRENTGQSNYGQTPTSNSLKTQSSQMAGQASQAAPSVHSIGSSRSMQHSRHPDMNSQSVSITARIVHAGRPASNEGDDFWGGPSLELQQSQVTVQHDPSAHARSQSKTSFFRVDRPPSLASRPDSRESTLSSRTKRSVDHGFNYLGFRKGNEQTAPPRSGRSPSVSTLQTVEEDSTDKNKSKAAKLFKRMSGLTGGSSRKAPAANGAGSSSGDGYRKSSPQSEYSQRSTSGGFVVGDLNVQFPDTLLWKRRWVEVDHSGFLVLSSTNANERARFPPRRYHMSEVKTPVVASQDGQELPYSILIDLPSGGTLQFACEDPVSQTQVLRGLCDVHQTWMHDVS